MSNPAAREKIDGVFTQWRSETDSVPQDERLRELLVGLLESEDPQSGDVSMGRITHALREAMAEARAKERGRCLDAVEDEYGKGCDGVIDAIVGKITNEGV